MSGCFAEMYSCRVSGTGFTPARVRQKENTCAIRALFAHYAVLATAPPHNTISTVAIRITKSRKRV
jgi:hypothetical protein